MGVRRGSDRKIIEVMSRSEGLEFNNLTGSPLTESILRNKLTGSREGSLNPTIFSTFLPYFYASGLLLKLSVSLFVVFRSS